jgi:dihydroorotate dehydrogenase electron transfer subunit
VPLDVEATVISNRRLSDEENVVGLAAPEIAAAAAPGQFVMVKATPGCDPLLRRPYSIYEVLRSDTGDPIGVSLLNKAVGTGTRLVLGLDINDRVSCLGPLGRPFTIVEPPAQVWMVAGGVGLAPFATLAERLRERGTAATLFYGGRRAEDLHDLDRFSALGVRLVLATEDGRQGDRGYITVPLERELARLGPASPAMLQVCGPTLMMRAVAALARAHGRACEVSLEPVMGCGLGGCYSCVVPLKVAGGVHYQRACVEGPVFDAARVAWEEMEG